MQTLMKKRAILGVLSVFVLGILMIPAQFSTGDILFEDDFEGGKLDAKKWVEHPNWHIIKPEENIKALGNEVLDFADGETNISIRDDIADFVFEADFNAKAAGKITGFVMRAQNKTNDLYMHQISANGSGHTPNNMRWHTKVGGGWQVEPIPFFDKEIVEPETWYRARFIVEGKNFKSYVLETEDFWKDPRNAKMRQIGDWDNDTYDEGAIGFRASGGEHMRYDNVLVYDIGDDVFAVEAGGKLAVTWGQLKQER
jgi:hypothetical protein